MLLPNPDEVQEQPGQMYGKRCRTSALIRGDKCHTIYSSLPVELRLIHVDHRGHPRGTFSRPTSADDNGGIDLWWNGRYFIHQDVMARELHGAVGVQGGWGVGRLVSTPPTCSNSAKKDSRSLLKATKSTSTSHAPMVASARAMVS